MSGGCKSVWMNDYARAGDWYMYGNMSERVCGCMSHYLMVIHYWMVIHYRIVCHYRMVIH